MAKLEIDLGTVNLAEVPEQHRQEAEHRARQAFVLALLEQGDLNVEQAAEVLGIERKEVVKLAAAHNISTLEIDAMLLGIDPEVLAYMNRQSDLFDEMRSELLSKYQGKWVAFKDGQVLDADEDEAALTKRVYAETGPRDLLIKKVLPEDPQPVVRTPFRLRSPYLG